jgi:TP53 regulating kinase-like protein
MDSSKLDLQPLHRGAEADLFIAHLAPWKVVVKRRVRKEYRNEHLDTTIRRERTVRESSIIRDARIAGTRTPSVIGLDLVRSSIIMTFVGGLLARDVIDTMDPSARLSLLEELGRQIGYLHSAGLVHGDLTTSNIIIQEDGKPVMIDFGMSTKSSEKEDQGTDLHLLRRSLAATHSLDSTSSLRKIERGYRETLGQKEAESSLKKAAEIARRGRYFAIR